MIIPELIGTRWYHYVLHNQTAALMVAYLRLSGSNESSSSTSPGILPVEGESPSSKVFNKEAAEFIWLLRRRAWQSKRTFWYGRCAAGLPGGSAGAEASTDSSAALMNGRPSTSLRPRSWT